MCSSLGLAGSSEFMVTSRAELEEQAGRWVTWMGQRLGGTEGTTYSVSAGTLRLWPPPCIMTDQGPGCEVPSSFEAIRC